jgi:hypothetical protein
VISLWPFSSKAWAYIRNLENGTEEIMKVACPCDILSNTNVLQWKPGICSINLTCNDLNFILYNIFFCIAKWKFGNSEQNMNLHSSDEHKIFFEFSYWGIKHLNLLSRILYFNPCPAEDPFFFNSVQFNSIQFYLCSIIYTTGKLTSQIKSCTSHRAVIIKYKQISMKLDTHYIYT